MRTALHIVANLLWFATTKATLSSKGQHKVEINGVHHYCEEIITRDVCIIGGGSAGTYSAVGLKDRKKSIVVVEQKDRLGGHTETYIDPATGTTIDIGVVVFHNLTVVTDYFAKFNVALKLDIFAFTANNYGIDFRTGKPVTVTPITPLEEGTALAAYAAQVAKYPSLATGFNLQYPVPADLLLPFGEFVKKYNLGDMVNVLFLEGEGLGNILIKPTLYAFNILGLSTIQGVEAGFLTTVAADNSELYVKAQAYLGKDVLLKTRVVATQRTGPGPTKIVVRDSEGKLKLIVAKKIIFAAPPKLNNLEGFDLDKTEKSLFSQFSNGGYYTGILKHTGLAPNISVTNYSDGPYNLAVLPGVYFVSSTDVPGLYAVKYGSPTQLSADFVKKDIIASVKRLSVRINDSEPEFVVFSDHSPFELEVSAKAIKEGFYKKLYALQGHNNMYYASAAFRCHDSSLIWQFIEALLPEIVSAV